MLLQKNCVYWACKYLLIQCLCWRTAWGWLGAFCTRGHIGWGITVVPELHFAYKSLWLRYPLAADTHSGVCVFHETFWEGKASGRSGCCAWGREAERGVLVQSRGFLAVPWPLQRLRLVPALPSPIQPSLIAIWMCHLLLLSQGQRGG